MHTCTWYAPSFKEEEGWNLYAFFLFYELHFWIPVSPKDNFFSSILSVWSDRCNQKLMDCSKFIELLLGSLRGLISVWNVDTLLCISSYFTPIINSHQLKLSLCKCIEDSEHAKFLKTSQGPTRSKWFSLVWSKITHG